MRVIKLSYTRIVFFSFSRNLQSLIFHVKANLSVNILHETLAVWWDFNAQTPNCCRQFLARAGSYVSLTRLIQPEQFDY